MFRIGWLSAWRRQLGLPARATPRRRTPRPACEELEGRSVPAAFTFSTGNPDGKMATLARPGPSTQPGIETETGDDFVLPVETLLNQATFTGLLPANTPLSSVTQVVIEIYRVFPKDSQNPPNGQVPTRDNSPSDKVFEDRDSSATTTTSTTTVTGKTGSLTFQATVVNPNFMAANSVVDKINPIPNQTTGGEGPVSGEEVTFTTNFTTPFDLPPDHYFFVPQVLVTGGNFLWLSAPKPIVAPGTPFTPDLQAWIRNAALDPNWLRIGTDIVGGTPAPTFNATFSLTGQTLTPTLTSLSKTGGTEGDPTFNLMVTGTNFTSASQVTFNGTPLTTTFGSATQLSAAVPASLLADEGAASVAVTDANRGTSGPLTFTVGEATPSATVSSSSLSKNGKGATLSGTFTDATAEGHVVRIDWGDGTSSTIDEGVGASGSFTASHKFKKKHKSANVRVTVLDDEGSASSPVTVTVKVPNKHKKH
jgi:hypothetical protein